MDLLKDRDLKHLLPWLEDGGPSGNEWGMRCPLHDDNNRSASVNIEKRLWMCQTCERRGPLHELVLEIKRKNIKGDEGRIPKIRVGRERDNGPVASEEQVYQWHQLLMSRPTELNKLMQRRGLSRKTIRQYQIGWNPNTGGTGAYTIPIHNRQSEITNVRFYQLDPQDDRRKIWSIKGAGGSMLFPLESLKAKDIIICEGEWDALITIQHGFTAITRTASASAWSAEWNELFRGKNVYLCHDKDKAGYKANEKIRAILKPYANSVQIIDLPFQYDEKHGKDLTDFWLEKHTVSEMKELMTGKRVPKEPVVPVAGQAAPATTTPRKPTAPTVSVLDSLGDKVGQPVTVHATVTGRITTPYLVPKVVHYTCTKDAGTKCEICPLYPTQDKDTPIFSSQRLNIPATDPVILQMMQVPVEARDTVLREQVGIPKCPKLEIEVQEFHSVEELFVRPAITEETVMTSGEYVNRKVIAVGNHDDMPNTTLTLTGAVFPSPKTGSNEFMAWRIVKTKTDLDEFIVDDGVIERLAIFQTEGSPLDKCYEIAEDLSRNVTEIYGRPEMHVFMDLIFHSLLQFPFGDKFENRGWLDGIIIGDTRTGKSEAALRLTEHYGMGQMISCESASFAGVVGGLEQMGGKEWIVRWGAIPLNDRRAAVLDEISGLSVEQIGQMSSIRSSGIAQLTKIQSESTLARTRLMWLGNPRPKPGNMSNSLDNFSQGVEALLPLVGTAEDIARFDFAMCVRSDQVSPEVINAVAQKKVHHFYTHELCHELLRWVWTREGKHVKWGKGAVDLCKSEAIDMSEVFCESPPLVQAANVRVKIARVAAAIAARTFSTINGKNVLVEQRHVRAAVEFMTQIYSQPSFGYGARSLAMKNKGVDHNAVENNDDLKNAAVINLLGSNDSFSEGQFAMATNQSLDMTRASLHNMGGSGMIQIAEGGRYEATTEGRRMIGDEQQAAFEYNQELRAREKRKVKKKI